MMKLQIAVLFALLARCLALATGSSGAGSSCTPTVARSFVEHLSPKYRTVLSDVDGTLLDSNHEMQLETISAIKELMAAGFAFYPCTGRSRESMVAAVGPEFMKLFGDGGVEGIPGVYQQGLMVYGPIGSPIGSGGNQVKLVHERLLPAELIEIVETFCGQNGISLIAYCGSTIYTALQTDDTRKIVEYKEPIPTLSQTKGAASLSALPAVGQPVHKVILLSDDAVLDRIRPLLESTISGRASVTKAVPGMLEVLPEGANKGQGVAALLQHLGTDPETVISFGDGENDVEMLALCGLGVAVGNARPVLKSAATLSLSKTNDQQAVAECLRELIAFAGGGLT